MSALGIKIGYKNKENKIKSEVTDICNTNPTINQFKEIKT